MYPIQDRGTPSPIGERPEIGPSRGRRLLVAGYSAAGRVMNGWRKTSPEADAGISDLLLVRDFGAAFLDFGRS